MNDIKLYNCDKKMEYVDTIDEVSRQKFAITLFKFSYDAECEKDKDISSFTTEEVVDVCMEHEIMVSKEIWLVKRILNDWAEYNGCNPIELPSEYEYKQKYIDRGVLNYVLSLEELMTDLLEITRKYCCYDEYHNDSEWLMVKAYIALKYLGLSDNEIAGLTSEILFPDYILPNGKTIVNEELKSLLAVCSESKGCTVVYKNGQHRSHKYTPAFEGQIIKSETETLRRAWTRLLAKNPREKLARKNVIYAGKFYDVYVEELKKENVSVVLSRSQINLTMKNNLTPNGFSLREEEIYQIYKAIRLRRFANLIST